MCDIKFRGKRADNGEWIYGYLVNMHATRGGWTKGIQIKSGIGWASVNVIPETVGQYAGFHDDSDDQVEVFGGDVVQFEYEGEGHTGEVRHVESGFMFVADSLPDGYIWACELIEFDRSYCWAEGVMVVGNIHDNGLAPKEGAEQHETD